MVAAVSLPVTLAGGGALGNLRGWRNVPYLDLGEEGWLQAGEKPQSRALRIAGSGDAWEAQWVEHLTRFRSGHDLRGVRSSPVSGSTRGQGACLGSSLPLSLSPSAPLSLHL